MRVPRHRQEWGEFERTIENKKLVIWGRSRSCIEICRKYPVAYIVDNNDELCDIHVENREICLPDRLYSEDWNEVVVLICAPEKYYREISRSLDEIGIVDVFFLNAMENNFVNRISNELFDHMDSILKVKSWLYDDYSKKVLQEVVNRRICGISTGYSDLKMNHEIQYLFPLAINGMTIVGGCILDGGGYIGDSIDRFVNRMGDTVRKIYTFEAMPENIKILEKKKAEIEKVWTGTLKIVPYALADKKGTVTFFETEKKGGCFSPEFRNGTQYLWKKPVRELKVDTVSIDEVIPQTEKVGYIKMDIEGAEYEALTGARETIIRERPGLAISIYHNAADYYRIAELIREYVPEYKLAVRHHKDKHVDTVLYAWI